MPELTQERLKELLHYDPESGIFTWKIRTCNRAMIGGSAGCLTTRGYISIGIDGEKYQAHRLAIFYMEGRWPDQTDHINHIHNDNRWINIRTANHQENSRNKPMQKNNKSGISGVCWNKKWQKWIAQIKVDGESILLGAFKSKLNAAIARRTAEKEHGFHANHGK